MPSTSHIRPGGTRVQEMSKMACSATLLEIRMWNLLGAILDLFRTPVMSFYSTAVTLLRPTTWSPTLLARLVLRVRTSTSLIYVRPVLPDDTPLFQPPRSHSAWWGRKCSLALEFCCNHLETVISVSQIHNFAQANFPKPSMPQRLAISFLYSMSTGVICK